jgi:LysR family transcriptional regulator for bpeEF and oprC
MDKLRAMQYFNRVVESGTFTAAARSLDISTPAVTQLVGALERSLSVALLHRTNRGLSLTPDGERYYETSRRLADELKDLESRLGAREAKPRGTLTVGMRHAVARYCVMPRITRFLERFPDIEIVTKPLLSMQDFAAENLDVAVQVGWPDERELAVRPLARTRLVVCASPEYLKRHGWPREPEDLRNHHCLVFRGAVTTLLDRWTFEKDSERRTIDVKTRLLSDDRTWLDEAACAGAGVIRFVDLTVGRYLSSGQLVPLLTEWEGLEAPVIYALYRRSERHSKLVRVFVDFLVEVFAELEAERPFGPARGVPRVAKPEWEGRAHGRHSAYVARKRIGDA